MVTQVDLLPGPATKTRFAHAGRYIVDIYGTPPTSINSFTWCKLLLRRYVRAQITYKNLYVLAVD